MEKKEDRRIAMTRRMLKDALTEMLRGRDAPTAESAALAEQIMAAREKALAL